MPHKDADARRAYRREWDKRNKDRLREKRCEQSRKYQKTHQEQVAARKKKYRQEHRAEIRLYMEAYKRTYIRKRTRAQAAEHARQFRANHPERARLDKRRGEASRRARKRHAFVETVDPRVVFKRDKGRCGICGKRVDVKSNWHIDHVIPLSKGGAHAYANVQLAHGACNMSKRVTIPKGQPTLFQVVPA